MYISAIKMKHESKRKQIKNKKKRYSLLPQLVEGVCFVLMLKTSFSLTDGLYH